MSINIYIIIFLLKFDKQLICNKLKYLINYFLTTFSYYRHYDYINIEYRTVYPI